MESVLSDEGFLHPSPCEDRAEDATEDAGSGPSSNPESPGSLTLDFLASDL